MSIPPHDKNFWRSHRIAISVILIIYVCSFAITYATENGFNPPFPSGSDLCVHVPMALQLKNPSLYSPSDEFISNYKAFFPTFYWRALALFSDPRVALVTGSIVLSLIFLIGVYFFMMGLTGDVWLSVFFSLLSIKSWPALNTLQWGGIWPEMVLPRTMVMVLSPFLFLGMYFSKSFWIDVALALALGILFHAHPMASHLFALWMVALWLKEDFKGFGKLVVKTMMLFGCFMIGALPSLKGVLLLSFGKYLGQSSVGTHVSVVPERSLHFLQFDAPSLLAFAFNIAPLALLAMLGFWHGEKSNVRRMIAGQIAAVLILTFGFLTIGQINPKWSFGEFPRMSIYLYLLGFFFAAQWLVGLRRRSASLFWIILSILALHHGSTYAAFGHIIAPGTAFANVFAKEPRTKWMTQDFLDLCEFAKTKTPLPSIFLVPPGGDIPKGFDLFRVYAERSIVVHWKGIYSDTDWDLYVRVLNDYRNRNAEGLLKIARSAEASYVVIPNSVEEMLQDQTLSQKPLVYRNKSYSLVKVQ